MLTSVKRHVSPGCEPQTIAGTILRKEAMNIGMWKKKISMKTRRCGPRTMETNDQRIIKVLAVISRYWEVLKGISNFFRENEV